MPVQVKHNPRKPRNNEAGMRAKPIRKGMHRPARSNPTDPIMHGRGNTCLIHLRARAIISLLVEPNPTVDL
jgi:hypothetical protein